MADGVPRLAQVPPCFFAHEHVFSFSFSFPHAHPPFVPAASTGPLRLRNLLSTSSGFQSAQFRVFENKLGLDPENRIKYNAAVYT